MAAVPSGATILVPTTWAAQSAEFSIAIGTPIFSACFRTGKAARKLPLVPLRPMTFERSTA